MKKAKISYPASWKYSLIVENSKDIEELVKGVLGSKEYELNVSNISKSGKFRSFTLCISVCSDEERIEVFEALRKICRFVL